jgi:nucleoside-diphosphate-sugar epimerase
VQNKEIVLHFAAIVPPRFQYEPLEYSKEVNVDGTKNLIEAMEEKNPEAKLLYPSSVAVFGDVRNKGKCVLTPDDPTNPNDDDLYAQQKVQAEELVQKSDLTWSIFRFGFMPNVDSLKFDPMMFDVPLDTNMEIIDVRDAAKAITHALEKEEIWGKKLHLAGGKSCRLTYKEFVTGMLETMGIGSLPDEAFTTNDFHCGFMDSDYSQELLDYQTRSYQDLLREMSAKAKGLAVLARVFRPFVKWFLLKKSPYYKKK